jgi:hypothetical protein
MIKLVITEIVHTPFARNALARQAVHARVPAPVPAPKIRTRDQLKTQLDTVAKAIAFANKLPESMGGPYFPRHSSYLKTIVNRIIFRIQRKYPDF